MHKAPMLTTPTSVRMCLDVAPLYFVYPHARPDGAHVCTRHRYADRKDVALIVLGIIGGVGTGR